MKKMPLFPRPWPEPLTGRGALHSRWRWQEPKESRVRRLPALGVTSKVPSRTSQAGVCQAERSVPSKRITATEGGTDAAARASAGRGATRGGTGRAGSCTGQPSGLIAGEGGVAGAGSAAGSAGAVSRMTRAMRARGNMGRVKRSKDGN